MTRQDLLNELLAERFGPVSRERRATPSPLVPARRELTELDCARNRRILCEALGGDPQEDIDLADGGEVRAS